MAEMTVEQQRALAMARARLRLKGVQPEAEQAAPQGGEATPAIDRFLTGLTDPIRGGTQLLYHALPESVVGAIDAAGNKLADMGLPIEKNEGGAESYDRRLRELEAGYRAPEGVDWARLGGSVAGTAPLALAGGGAGLGAQALRGAGQGAAIGMAQPALGDGSFAAQKAGQAATGAALGAAAPVALAGAARVVKPATREGVNLLKKEGVRLTPGQAVGGVPRVLEEQAKSIPATGHAIAAAERRALEDFNRAGINRALAPIGSKMPRTAEVGHRGLEQAHAKISGAYDTLLPKMQVKVDRPFVKDLRGLTAMAKSMPPERAKQFEAVLKSEVLDRLTPQGNGSGETAKLVQSRLGALSRQYASSPDADQRLLGQAIGELRQSFTSMLKRNNPRYAPRLAKADEAYANLLILERAAQNTAEGVFTPNQLRSAVRAADPTLRKRATAHGKARMQDLARAGQQVLQSKTPDSGTAGRMLLSGGVLGAGVYNPAVFLPPLAGAVPYMPPIQQALVGLLTNRPQGAQTVADLLRRAAPGVTAGTVPAATGP